MIKKTFEQFVEFYRVTQGYLTKEDTIIRINTADCGNTAVAIGLVLEQKYGIKLDYVDCVNHAYLRIEGKAYDTANDTGVEEKLIWEQYSVSAGTKCTVEELFAGYNTCDVLGSCLIERFLTLQGVPVPKWVTDIYDVDPDEYTGTWLKPIRAKIDAYTLPGEN